MLLNATVNKELVGADFEEIGRMRGVDPYDTVLDLLLQYDVRDRKILGLADAVQRITSVPARRHGLKDRGSLRVGHKADICVFDPTTIASNSTARHLRRCASGIAHVLVNGKLSMHNGVRTQENSAEVLRSFV